MKTYISISIFGLLTLLHASCKDIQEPQNQVTATPPSENVVLSDEQLSLVGITTTKIHEKEIVKQVELTGRVSVLNNDFVSISSPLGGHVIAVNFLAGQSFKKGEVLGRIEDQKFIDLQQDYLIAVSELHVAKENLKRQSELNKTKTTSDKVLQSSRSSYEILQAQKSALEQKLRLISINPASVTSANISSTVSLYAPFSGIVAEVLVNKGQYVTNTDVLFNLIDPKGYVFEFNVFEKDLEHLEIGQQVFVSTNSTIDNQQKTTILSISKKVNQQGTSIVITQGKEALANWPIGRYVHGKVILDNMLAQGVSAESVVSFEDKTFVFEALSANEFKAIEVQLGEQSGSFIALDNAAELQGKHVVERGAYDLLMALKNTADLE